MTKVFDEAHLARAAHEAERALAEGEADALAGRFSPGWAEEQETDKPGALGPIGVGLARKQVV